MFHIWYTIWYGVTYPDVCCTSLCYRCTVCFALITPYVLCQTLLSVWSDIFMLSPYTLECSAHWTASPFFISFHRSHFDPMKTSLYTLNNSSMYQLFHTFPHNTIFHLPLYTLSPNLPYFSHTFPLFSLLFINTHSILLRIPITLPYCSMLCTTCSLHHVLLDPFLSFFLIGFVAISSLRLGGGHVSG